MNVIDVSKTGNNLNLNENDKKRKTNEDMLIDDTSMKKLTGQGNLIKKVESIKKLGAKGTKNFNDKLLNSALEDED